MTALDFVVPGATPTTRNILLYGPSGSGKSCGAATAPGPILWLNAEGENALLDARERSGADIREVTMTGLQSMVEVMRYLKAGGDGERTVVIDTIGEVHRVLLEEIAAKGTPQIQHYGQANTQIERFVRALRDLPFNLVILAHEEIADIDGIPTRRPVTGGKKLPEQVMAQMDEVGYTALIPASDKSPEPRCMAQLFEGNGRRAKNRGGRLGQYAQVDLTKWIEKTTGGKN